MSEVQTVSGIVEAVRKDNKGLKLSDGNWYSTLDPTAIGCRRGDAVTFEYSTNAKGGRTFLNIRGKVAVTGASPVSDYGAADAPSGARRPSNLLPVDLARERAIIRQNALTNAVNFCSGSDSISAMQVIDVARVFEAYTSGDADIEASKEDPVGEAKMPTRVPSPDIIRADTAARMAALMSESEKAASF